MKNKFNRNQKDVKKPELKLVGIFPVIKPNRIFTNELFKSM